MECAGRAQRRRRFGPREGRWFWLSTCHVSRKSGVALRLPPQSKRSRTALGVYGFSPQNLHNSSIERMLLDDVIEMVQQYYRARLLAE
jgi:hypothetical protein